MASSGLITLSNPASTGAVAATLVAPSDIRKGDILVTYNHSYNSSSTIPTAVTPTGFTQIHNTSLVAGNGYGHRAISAYKIADGTEGGATITFMSGAIPVCYLYVFRTNSNSPSVSVTLGGATMTDSDPADYTLSLSSMKTPVLAFGVCRNDTGTQISFSPTPDIQAPDTTNSYRFACKIFNSNPVDFTVSSGDGGFANFQAAFSIRVF